MRTSSAVNRDDAEVKNIDNLKSGSPLGIEPKCDVITGQSVFSTGAASERRQYRSAPKTPHLPRGW